MSQITFFLTSICQMKDKQKILKKLNNLFNVFSHGSERVK